MFAGADAAPTTAAPDQPSYSLATDDDDSSEHYFNIWDIPNSTFQDIMDQKCNDLNRSKLLLHIDQECFIALTFCLAWT